MPDTNIDGNGLRGYVAESKKQRHSFMTNEPMKLEIFCNEVWGQSSRRYRQIAKEGNAPEPVKGMINPMEAARALFEYQSKLIKGGGSVTLMDERIRLTKINADQKQMNYDRESGELIHVGTAQTLWGQVMMQIRQKILAVPVKLPPLVIGEDNLAVVKETVEKFMHEVLMEMSNVDLTKKRPRKKSAGSVKGSSGNAKASAKKKSVGVGRKRAKVKPRSKR